MDSVDNEMVIFLFDFCVLELSQSVSFHQMRQNMVLGFSLQMKI